MPKDHKFAWRDWFNGNEKVSLATLFALERIDEWTYRSAYPAYGPGNSIRAFGGHVFAQCVLAGAKTVRSGFVVHSITGHFLLIGVTNLPFVYKVSVVRDGGGYCQRRVDALQEEDKGIVFTAVVSFKKPETSEAVRFHEGNINTRYKGLLDGREPESWPEAPGVDSPFWWELEKTNGVDKFPGLDMRKCDMEPYNQHRKTLDRRQLQFYRVIGLIPSIAEDPNLHAAGHLYASDRNGLFPIPNFLDMGNTYSAIASLSHTVVFHAEAEEFNLLDQKGQPKWFCFEEAIDHISHGRALATFRLWDTTTNKPIVSAMQDGLVRFRAGVSQGRDKMVFAEPKKGPSKSEKDISKL